LKPTEQEFALESLRPALLAAAGELALDLPSTQADALLAYLGLLRRWNVTYNLTAVREPGQMLTQHIADCLAVVNPLRLVSKGRPIRFLDVGSGGGLPGVVIALTNPEFDVTCIDAVGKKAAFVRQVGAELGRSNLHAHHGRVEALKDSVFDVVGSRACASLADFVTWTRHCVSDQGVWMAMKGRRPGEEIAELPSGVDVFHVEPLQVPNLDAERCIVWMRPREPARSGSL
jgi:16S rRNA (guanine527-N7)-methyltransferase